MKWNSSMEVDTCCFALNSFLLCLWFFVIVWVCHTASVFQKWKLQLKTSCLVFTEFENYFLNFAFCCQYMCVCLVCFCFHVFALSSLPRSAIVYHFSWVSISFSPRSAMEMRQMLEERRCAKREKPSYEEMHQTLDALWPLRNHILFVYHRL